MAVTLLKRKAKRRKVNSLRRKSRLKFLTKAIIKQPDQELPTKAVE